MRILGVLPEPPTDFLTRSEAIELCDRERIDDDIELKLRRERSSRIAQLAENAVDIGSFSDIFCSSRDGKHNNSSNSSNGDTGRYQGCTYCESSATQTSVLYVDSPSVFR